MSDAIMQKVVLLNSKITYASLKSEVECIQYTSENMDAIQAWCGAEMHTTESNVHTSAHVLADQMMRTGDWIVRIGQRWVVLRKDEFMRLFEENK